MGAVCACQSNEDCPDESKDWDVLPDDQRRTLLRSAEPEKLAQILNLPPDRSVQRLLVEAAGPDKTAEQQRLIDYYQTGVHLEECARLLRALDLTVLKDEAEQVFQCSDRVFAEMPPESKRDVLRCMAPDERAEVWARIANISIKITANTPSDDHSHVLPIHSQQTLGDLKREYAFALKNAGTAGDDSGGAWP